ncbi:MAG: class I mannose-6-phosphate isomerase [Clostridia bacterium]|nr:class I mannose-6-phosphate isomerase [Clostridia bacterium]
MKPYPALLAPILRPLPWGGDRLKKLSSRLNEDAPVGEAWVMTEREGAVSQVLNGPLAGSDLSRYLGAFPGALGTACGSGIFPLLVKIIDAADKLSVQVHPDDGYAARFEKEPGKCEIWYVIEALPGSEIIAGLAPGTDINSVTSAEPKERFFRKIFPAPGDVVFIPPGLVHSIGAGILICEIQQNSDLTYRIFDFGRKWGGVPRQLHLQKAADCLVNYSNDDIEKIRFSKGGNDDPEILCSCDKFTVRKSVADTGKPVVFRVKNDRFASLTVVSPDAEAELVSECGSVPLSFGSCVFLPAGCGEVTVRGNAVCLFAEI